MIEQEDNVVETHYFFLFVNSKSGGCKGKQYLTVPNRYLKLKSKQGFYCHVYLYDMFNKDEREDGFKNVLNFAKHEKNLNVIACGGDGTILWVVNSAIKAGIDPEDVCFGVIPIGTGNDFSRSLGWGGSPITFKQDSIRELRKLIQRWVRASKQYFDLWDVSIETFEDGNIVSSSSNVQSSSQNVTILFKTFSNYVGIGIDARVSYYFQKNRTPSKLFNLALYGCIGFLCCLRNTQKMHNAITQFTESQSDSEAEPDPDDLITNEGSEATKRTIINKENMNMFEKNKSVEYEVKLKSGYTGIVCLNCTSYMSGVKNVFSTRRIGATNKVHEDFGRQSYNDGKVQFVGFKNQLALGLERFVSTAARLSQGEGPFTIKFKKEKKNRETFVQIDGQAVIVTQLKQIKITRTKLTESGKIRVLINNQ